MNYSLAKQLKDAGFQTNNDEGYLEDGTYVHGCNHEEYYPNGRPIYFIPTLEELIDECMKGLPDTLHFELHGQTSWWCIIRYGDNKAYVPVCTGSTPLEAVARLWLELNKK